MARYSRDLQNEPQAVLAVSIGTKDGQLPLSILTVSYVYRLGIVRIVSEPRPSGASSPTWRFSHRRTVGAPPNGRQLPCRRISLGPQMFIPNPRSVRTSSFFSQRLSGE